MGAADKIITVEDALAASHTLLTVREIMRETGHAEPVVRAELRRLAGQGQIEHIPGRGRYDGRYGLLRPIEKAAPASDAALTNEGTSTAGEQNNADEALPSVGDQTFQSRVQPWLMECFGSMIAGDKEERNHRFLEEALELVQACGCTVDEAMQLVGYVYGRPTGDAPQEVGGVMITLAALCLAQGIDMHAAGEAELARIWTKVEQIRAKQAAKPKYSPLPIVQPPSDADISLLAVIADIHAAVRDSDGRIMLSDLAEHIRAIYELGEAHRRACMEWERSMMAAIGEDGVGSVVEAIGKLRAELSTLRAEYNSTGDILGEITGDFDSDRDLWELAAEARGKIATLAAELANARALNIKLEHLLGSERTANAALREQLDNTVSPEIGSIAPAGYLVRAPKRAHRIVTKQDRAQAHAMAAAANGSGRGEVFALVPIGVAKRGAVWRAA